MVTLSTSLPIRLLKQAQSTRISLPKRLRALGELALGIDQSVAVLDRQLPVEQPHIDVAVNAPDCGTNTVDVATLLDEASHLVHAQLLPRIRRYRVQIVTVEQFTEAQKSWLWHYFQQQIYPLLTPLAIDSGHPFPYLQGRRLNFLVVLQANAQPGRNRDRYGVVQIPARLPRLIQVQPCPTPETNVTRTRPLRHLVWCEEIVRYFLPTLFSGLTVGNAYQFRLLRATSEGHPMALSVNGLQAARPQQGLPQAPVTRLDLEEGMPSHLRRWLINHLHVTEESVVDCTTPLGLADLGQLADYLKPV